MNNYTCPRPSCAGQRLLKKSNTTDYFCYSCQQTYVIGSNGVPRLKNPLVKEKKSKYKNKRVQVDGIYFDSQAEADYYCQLKVRRQANDIKWFALQPRFILQDGDKKIEYRADFIIVENDGTARIIDVKGHETDTFKIKKKLLEVQYDMTLELVKA